MKITVQKVDGGFILSDGEKSVVARKYDLYKKMMLILGETDEKPYPKPDNIN